MEFCHLELELSGCNEEMAALHSDHCTQVSRLVPGHSPSFSKLHAEKPVLLRVTLENWE